MSNIPINDPASPTRSGWRPLGLGFRPFFLLGGYAAPALIAAWLLAWHGTPPRLATYYGPIHWHSHEMLFGYVVAVISGFLLTAVRNWTGQRTASGVPLGLLALLWLAGRLLPWAAAVPDGLQAAVDLAFLPALAWALTGPLWAGTNRVNRLFVPLLLAMAVANGLVHAQALGWTTATAARGLDLMLDLVILLLVFVGGRVMPFFTEKAVHGAKPKQRAWVENLGFALLLLLGLLHLVGAPRWLVGVAFIAAGLVQALRLWGWHHRQIWGIPILWVLYTGYAWLVAGLLLSGLSAFALFPPSLATHALTVGGAGVLTLGMMARVALGHTGRDLQTATAINIAFVLINLAAATRVLGPALWPAAYVGWILLAGLLWILAFALFAWRYTPILLRPRADGRPD